MDLGPVTAEAKNSLTCGMANAAWASTFNKTHLKAVRCDGTTHVLPGFDNTRSQDIPFYMFAWVGFECLPFFRCDHCSLTDAIATSLGAVRAEVRDVPGCSNWLFPSKALSSRHFYQCLMILGGSLAYFRRLHKRIVRTVEKNGWAIKKENCTVMSLEVQTSRVIGSPVLFYVLLRKSQNTGVLQWYLMPAPGDEKVKPGANPLTLDILSWKTSQGTRGHRRQQKRASAAQKRMLGFLPAHNKTS